MTRRIKYFAGQNETLPIKDPRLLEEFMYSLLKKRDQAKTEKKRRQADRNWMLALIGINTAFRAEDLLQLRVRDVKDGYFHIKENKTGKMQNFRMNRKLYKDILDYIERNHLAEYDYLFMGQKKKQTYAGHTYSIVYPITRQQGRNIIKKAGTDIGIKFVFGLHSLRKTFGYHYIKNGGKPETLMKMYNHDDYNTTLIYVHWGTDDAEKDREAVYLGGVHYSRKKVN